MGTILIVILLISLTFWFKRNDWFPKTRNTHHTSSSVSTTPSTISPPPPTNPASGTTPTKTGFWKVVFGILGFVAIAFLLFFMSVFAYKAYKSLKETPTPPPTAVINVEDFPHSGAGYVRKDVGLKAWLDPANTFTRSENRAVRYVFAENPNLVFDDLPGNNTNRAKWLKMPTGKYFVYPLKDNEVFFRWWSQ